MCQQLELVEGGLGVREADHLDLVELVQPDVSAGVLAGRPRLAAPAGGVGHMADGEVGAIEDLLAVEVGHRHLGGADHALASHQVGRQDLGVAVLAGRDVEHPGDQGTLQPGALAAQDGEAGPADLGGALEVEDAEPVPQLEVGARLEVEVRGVAPGANRDVAAVVGADGGGLVRRVGDIEEERLDAPLQLAQLGLARLHPGLELGELRPLLVGGGTADGGGGAAALGLGRFDLVAEPPGSHVELEDLVDGGRLVLELRPPAEVVGVIAQGLERDHASASASPVGRMVGNSSTSRMPGLSVSSMTKRSTPMPRPPAGGMPASMASRKSSSRGWVSVAPRSRWRACSSKRARWSMGSLSSLKALASSRPATTSSKRSTNRGSSLRRRGTGLTSAG